MRGAFAAFGEEVFREGDFFGGIECVVGEGPRDGFVENFDVGEKRGDGGVAGEGIDLGAEGGGASGEFGAVGVGERDALGGDFFGTGAVWAPAVNVNVRTRARARAAGERMEERFLTTEGTDEMARVRR